MNRPEELKALLMQALDTPAGLILRVDGGERNKVSAALAAISAARRELMIDEPRMIDLRVMKVPGRDEIALKLLITPDEE